MKFSWPDTLEWLRSSLWVPPVGGAVFAVGIGSALTAGQSGTDGWRNSFGYRGSVDSANDLLIGELGTLVTALAVAFSMVLIALQLASSQFSPRVVRTWTRDSVTKVTLTVYLSSIAYVLSVIHGIAGENGPAPSVAVSLSMLLVMASAISSVAYFHHLAQTVRLENLLRNVQGLGRVAVEKMAAVEQESVVLDPNNHIRREVRVLRDGYVRGLRSPSDRSEVGEVSSDLEMRLDVGVGDWLAKGQPLVCFVSKASQEIATERLERIADVFLDLSDDRSVGEVGLTIRLLVDFAVKAISPAVNDPYTAVQSVQRLKSLLLQVQNAELSYPQLQSDTVTVGLRQRTLNDHLTLACDQITRFSERSPSVLLAIVDLLHAIGTDLEAVAERMELVRQVAETLLYAADREMVLAAIESPGQSSRRPELL